MAEEFQAGVCGENWWNPSRSVFMASPCSLGLNDLGIFGYNPTDHDHMLDSKSKSFFGDSSYSNSSSCLAFEQDNILGFGFGVSISTSPISDFNRADYLLNGRVDSNNSYQSILQEDKFMCTNKLNCRKESTGLKTSSQIQKDCWSPNNNLDHDPNYFNSFMNNNNQGLSSGFPVTSSASFGYNTTSTYTTTSMLLQSLFDEEESQSQQSFCNINNNISSNNPTSASNNNISPFWNAPNSSQSHCVNLNKRNNNDDNEEAQDYSGGSDNQPVFKRPRFETPSPLPTFKVRKEKLGDRITALQQLVSPFGKTDTASVLHEAIEYIKFLHHQVSTLSSPYTKNGDNYSNNQQPKGFDSRIIKESECPNQDLKSRGLCLVPISGTVPLASETTPDFWTPNWVNKMMIHTNKA